MSISILDSFDPQKYQSYGDMKVPCKFCYNMIDLTSQNLDIQSHGGFRYVECPECGQFVYLENKERKEEQNENEGGQGGQNSSDDDDDNTARFAVYAGAPFNRLIVPNERLTIDPEYDSVQLYLYDAENDQIAVTGVVEESVARYGYSVLDIDLTYIQDDPNMTDYTHWVIAPRDDNYRNCIGALTVTPFGEGYNDTPSISFEVLFTRAQEQPQVEPEVTTNYYYRIRQDQQGQYYPISELDITPLFDNTTVTIHQNQQCIELVVYDSSTGTFSSATSDFGIFDHGLQKKSGILYDGQYNQIDNANSWIVYANSDNEPGDYYFELAHSGVTFLTVNLTVTPESI